MPLKKKKVSKKYSSSKKIGKSLKTFKKESSRKARHYPVREKNISRDRVESEGKAKITKGAKTPTLLRGMKDILPKEEFFWLKIYHTAEEIAKAYGFGFLETPILEDASLFVRSLGKGTDVVEKEMYIFEDRDGLRICLRPENTASVARAYIIHGMHSHPQPVKFWYYGPMFRHDRPQAGRYRQFHQFGCETFGERSPVIDAELVAVAYYFLCDLGITTNVFINSLGNPADRQNYLVELVGYLRNKRSYLCEDCRRRMARNPLRVLDCKAEGCQPIIEEAPQIVEWLCPESRAYFTKVLEYLDDLDIPYVLKHTLVRGLDYYTDTVFEIFEEDSKQESQGALCGGGRFDLLVEQLGGRPAPACGFSVGLERVVSVLRRQAEERKLNFTESKFPVFFAQLGEQARSRTLRLIEELRKGGMYVHHNLAKTSLKAQLEAANKYGVKYTLILGQKEVQDGTIIIRDMESGIQEIVDQEKLKQQMEKKLYQV